MNVCILLNAFAPDAARQAAALAAMASRLGGACQALILCPTGLDPQSLCHCLPVPRVTVLTAYEYRPEPFLEVLCGWFPSDCLCLLDSGDASRDLAVRLSCRTGGSFAAGIHAVSRDGGTLTLGRMVYAGHMEGRFSPSRFPCFASLAPGLPAGMGDPGPLPAIETVPLSVLPPPGAVLLQRQGERPLQHAKLIIAVGRGIGGPEQVAQARRLAAALGGELGVTRAVAALGWAPMDRILGISGVTAAPELCLVLGASGAAAFFAGIAKSKTIVAVNTDPGAPILRSADAYILQDCREVLDALAALLFSSSQPEVTSHGTAPHSALGQPL